MAFFSSIAAAWRSARFAGLLLLLLAALGLQKSCEAPGRELGPALVPAQLVAYRAPLATEPGDTSTSAPGHHAGGLYHIERRSLPRSQWRGFRGPSYLVYPLPRRPKQAELDAAAAAARRS